MKTKKLKRRRQNGGNRIRSLMKSIATSLSPASMFMGTRKSRSASVTPDDQAEPVKMTRQERRVKTDSRKSNSEAKAQAKKATAEEKARAAKAAAQAKQAKEIAAEQEAQAKAVAKAAKENAKLAEEIKSSIEEHNQIREILGLGRYSVMTDEEAIEELARITKEQGQQPVTMTDEEVDVDKEIAALELEAALRSNTNGGKKSRTRRRHKKSRKY